MVEIVFRVGVIVRWRAIDHPWVDHVWEPVAVLPDAPETVPGTRLSTADRVAEIYLGAADLVLAASDTAQYRDNLMQPPPRLWVVLREAPGAELPDLVAVTADPMEAEGFAEDAGNIVGAVAMDRDLAAEVARFVDAHHVERVFVKRKRKQHRDGEVTP